jgi:deoxyribodipyrimidine photo-lyase
MAPKRKAAASTSNGTHTSAPTTPKSASKKRKVTANGESSYSDSLVNNDLYPYATISDARAKQYNTGQLPRPYDLLETKISSTSKDRESIKPGKAVLHWFKRDLRLFDNRGLAAAAKLAKEHNITLICLFIISPQDYEAHFTSSARVDFELRTLEVLKKDLGKLDVPLVVETLAERKDVTSWIVSFCEKQGIKNVFCNIEYEVDELRREIKLVDTCLDKGIAFNPVHDDVVVAPGNLVTGTGNQYAVYTPWYRSWVKYLHNHPDLLVASPKPGKNPSSARKEFKSLFDGAIPSASKNKTLTSEEKQRFREIWPAGEHEAMERLEKFAQSRISDYSKLRNTPSVNGVSMLSVHHAAGTLAARTSVRKAKEVNSSKALDGGKEGITTWISEVAWRDFYKHVMAHWPYVCMFKPFKIEYANVEWDYNDEVFDAWCDGKTGFPIGKHSIAFHD